MSWKLPQTTGWMRDQMAHEPSRGYAEQIYEVVKAHPYKNALEIGNAWGISTLAILLAGQGKLLSVDKSTQTRAPEEVARNKLSDRCAFMTMASDDFWRQNQTAYDLIYIDGSHLYKDVVNDLFRAWEWLNPGAMLLLDDFTHKANQEYDPNTKESIYGISLAAWELVQQKGITQVNTTERLLWFHR
jgi:predicted O-methyltransferase YrrM